MTRHTLRPNPHRKTHADPLYLILTDARAIIGAIYHESPGWAMIAKSGATLKAPTLRALRTAIREHYAMESTA